MRLYISLSLAIVALLAHFNNAALQDNCPQDIIFIVDTSESTNGILYNSFILSLQQFVSRSQISNTNIRAAAVFMNDQRIQTVSINGNGNVLRSEFSNGANFLGSSLLISNGLNAATNLFNIAGRPTATKTAIVVTANPSRNSVIPVFQANQLKQVATVYTIGVQKPNGGIPYNVNELNRISTSGSRVDISVSSTQLSTMLLAEYDRISNLGCGVSTIPGTVSPPSNTICTDCDAENGVGYMTYKNPAGVVDGRYFVQCKKEDFGSGYIANVLRCPDSLFWHNDLKNCVALISSDNYQGQCEPGRPSYVFPSSSCGAYFNCTNSQMSSQCCPDNTGFDSVQNRCVQDSTCQYHCSDPQPRAVNCDKRVITMDNGQVNPCKYNWIISSSVSYEMPCGAGTNFNVSTCSCTIHNTAPCPGTYVDPCVADVNVNFDANNVVDTRGSTVNNKGGVSISNGRATFNGQDRQRVAFMRYTNNDFTLPLAITIKYRETESRSNMALLATGDCLSKPGLYILVGNGRVTLGLHTASEGYDVKYETSATAPGQNQWKEVVFHFDGKVLQGEVRTLDNNGNSIVSRTPIAQRTVSSGEGVRILKTDGAMVLGYAHDSTYPGYVGEVDDVSVYRGCTTKASPSDF